MKNSKFKPIVLKHETGATPLSFEQAKTFLTDAEIAAGEKRFEIETRGPWGQVSKVAGVAITATWIAETFGRRYIETMTIHGPRVLANAHEMGYDMEGRVSIDGKVWRAFTSSILFELPDKRLINVAVLHVCVGQRGGKEVAA